MAMPWTLAKAKAAAIRADTTGAELAKLNAIFNAHFRIQREASAAAGRHIPMVVENVRGAQAWVGRAKWNFGSYYLWGDVPALMPQTIKAQKNPGFRFDGSGRSFQSESVARHVYGVKVPSESGRRTAPGNGARFTSRDCGVEGVKQAGLSGVCANGKGDRWFQDGAAQSSSKSPARKAAAARIAKIPFPLSSWIARTYLPEARQAA